MCKTVGKMQCLKNDLKFKVLEGLLLLSLITYQVLEDLLLLSLTTCGTKIISIIFFFLIENCYLLT